MKAESLLRTRESRTLHIAWIGALLAAALTRILLIDRHGLGNYELITFVAIQAPPLELIMERLGSSHMPLFFLLEKMVVGVFGTSEIAMRLVSATFGWLAVWATGRLARRIGGLPLAVPVVCAAAIHEQWLALSFEARMYSMLMWASAESTDAWLAWRGGAGPEPRRDSRLPAFRWILASVIGLLSHLLFIPILLLQGFEYLLGRRADSREHRWMLISLAVPALVALVLSALWVFNQTKFYAGATPSPSSPRNLLLPTVQLFWGEFRNFPWWLPRFVAGLISVLFVLGLASASILGRFPNQKFVSRAMAGNARLLAVIVAGWLFFLAGMVAFSRFTNEPLILRERYQSAFLPFALILGYGVLLSCLPASPKVILPAVVLVFAIQAVPSVYRFKGHGDGLRESFAFLEDELSSDQGLVMYGSPIVLQTFGRYYGRDIRQKHLRLNARLATEEDIRRLLEGYTAQYPDFWLLRFRGDRHKLREGLRPTLEIFDAIDRKKIGDVRLTYYRRASDDAGSRRSLRDESWELGGGKMLAVEPARLD